mmetsp:Transcript_4233/g.10630  ORF Transcript_4233/g.10630 Transcript_4233/m.10630 type:complete len:287 (-) Transcript_4233:546-1406(-)
MARCPRSVVANSLGGRVPRKRVRVSLMAPVTRSISVRSSTPLARPLCRNRLPAPASSSLMLSPVTGLSMMRRLSGTAGSACTASVARQSSGSRLRMRTCDAWSPTARNLLRWRPSGTGAMSRAAMSPLMSFFSVSTRLPRTSSSKYMRSPPESAMATWLLLAAAFCTCRRPGVCHSATRLEEEMWRSPEGCTWSSEPSSMSCVHRVGTVPRNPLSLTSSTVSPIDSTSVALEKETTMYESKSLVTEVRMVHTAVGLPGSGDAAISVTPSPGRSTRSVERGPRPHRA